MAGVRAQALDMVTQRGYSRRSVAHIAAALRGPCFEPLISDHCTDRAVLYAYPRLGVYRRRRRRGSQSRSNCCLSRTSAKTGSCRGPFHLALRKVPAGVCPMSRIGHPQVLSVEATPSLKAVGDVPAIGFGCRRLRCGHATMLLHPAEAGYHGRLIWMSKISTALRRTAVYRGLPGRPLPLSWRTYSLSPTAVSPHIRRPATRPSSHGRQDPRIPSPRPKIRL